MKKQIFEKRKYAMNTKFLKGDTVYLISSKYFIEEATVVMNLAGFVTIRFTKRGGGTRVRENRLYATREEAETAVKKWFDGYADRKHITYWKVEKSL